MAGSRSKDDMTEIEYVLENFNDRFASMHDKRILLHGSRNYAEAILRRFGKEFNFTGVMSMDPLAEEVWNGLPVFREGDLPGRVDLVILTERVKYEEAAFLSLRRSCRKNRIEIYNMYGQDEFALHLEAGSAEPLCLEGALQRCLPYDIVSFEVLGTVSAEYQSFIVSLKRLNKLFGDNDFVTWYQSLSIIHFVIMRS